MQHWDYNVSVYPIAPSDQWDCNQDMVIIMDWNKVPDAVYSAVESILNDSGYVLGFYDDWVTSDDYAYCTNNMAGNHFIIGDGYIIGDDDQIVKDCNVSIEDLNGEISYYGNVIDLSNLPNFFECLVNDDDHYKHCLDISQKSYFFEVEDFIERHIKKYPHDVIIHDHDDRLLIYRNYL